MWNDEKFRTLSTEGKLAFVLLLTHPHMTALGAMRATIPGLAAELGGKGFAEAFREVFAKGLAKHDEKASCVYLPRFLKYNKPESPNVVKAWAHSIDLIPECHLKSELIQEVKGFAEALPEAFGKALPEAFAKAMPNQEQEQEQEQEEIPPLIPPLGGKTVIRAERKVKGTRLPEDWCHDIKHEHLAKEMGVNLFDELMKFRDYWASEGRAKANWNATFNTWLRNAGERRNRATTWSRK
jgi:hypothetical protein